MTKILIIEDETMLSDFVADALENHLECEIVDKVEDGLKGIEACLEHKPDFVILDVNLPSLNGIEVLQQIKQKLPKTKVLLFSAYFNRSIIRKALKCGVEGIIEKTARLAEMNEAIDKVISGETYFGPMIVNMVRDVMINPDVEDSLELLSAREKEVLQLIAEGHSTKDIAEKLNISVKTASTHRAHLMQKLDIHGVAELTRFAINEGLVDVKRGPSE